ncbi:MAG: PmoA family protein [Verrucomicrobia bacterium]|nr:PmoA family protein [Verrucomicrobiota bacterium]
MKTLLLLCSVLAFSATGRAAQGVKLTDADGFVRVEISGKFFTDYHYANVPRPFLYPVIGPTGAGMTRNFPMKDVEGESHDHPHHRGLSWSHMRVNEVDTWGEVTNKSGKIVHQKFLELTSGAKVGVLREENQFVSVAGKVVGSETRTLRFYDRAPERVMDFDIVLRATHGELVLGDQKDGGMGIRLAESMRVAGEKKKGEKKAAPGVGHIVNSEGVRDAEAWGKRAKWCDYFGPVEGKTVGVAIFDHPSNPRHPTWWHVRTYGLFTANPFGISSFEKNPDKNAGNFTIPAGQSATFRYRFYFHEGDEQSAKVEERYGAYVKESEPAAKAKR